MKTRDPLSGSNAIIYVDWHITFYRITMSPLNKFGFPVKPKARIIVVSYNSSSVIRNCIDSIQNQSLNPGLELVVVDNNSEDETVSVITDCYPWIDVIQNIANLGFAAACNQAICATDTSYVILVNPDAVLSRHCIERAIRYLEKNPSCGIVGGSLRNDDGGYAPSARSFPDVFLKARQYLYGYSESESLKQPSESVREVDWVPGAFTCIRCRMLEEIGQFDERFFLYYEETDLCKRASQAGWTVVCLAECEIAHEGGGSSRTVDGEAFDDSGSQLRRLRMYAECLYHRKHHGVFGLVSVMGFEWLWHALRVLKTFLARTRSGWNIRDESKSIMNGIQHALKATSWGTVSPTKPW